MSRRGFVLIEVVVALVVLGFGGLALIELAAQSLRVLARVRATEERTIDEDRLLAAHALLDRGDLIRRVGWRRVGPYDVWIRREGFSLFRVSVGPAGQEPELRTTIYRPESENE